MSRSLRPFTTTNPSLATRFGSGIALPAECWRRTLGDADHSSWKANTRLETLAIEQAPHLTGSGFPAGEDWPRLWYLGVAGCPIDNAGVERIARFPELFWLKLDDVQVTDAGICRADWQPALERFESNCIPLSDEGLRHLADAMTIDDPRKTCLHALAGGRTLAEARDAVEHANVSITSAYLHVAVEDDAIGRGFG